VGKVHQLPCGCAFPVLEEREGDEPLLDYRVESTPESCRAVWEMLAVGLTKGVFQLESGLGRQWTKRLKPESVEHLAALTAILRPGSLAAVDEEGVSTTEHYCRRKNGEEAVPPIHPVVDPILADTYNLIIYQEQAMALTQAVAGFDLREADALRKAMGKKLPEEMAKVKAKFLEKSRALAAVPFELAEHLFGIIEESQRYSFNRSHSMGYGTTSYDTAYLKAHFPAPFFAAFIKNATEKPKPTEERSELIAEAKAMGVTVVVPDFRKVEPLTALDRGVVRLGWADVRGLGTSTVQKLAEAVKVVEGELGKGPADWAWGDVVSRLVPRLPAAPLTFLAQAGAFTPYGLSRRRAAYEVQQLNEINETEWKWVLARPPFATAAELCRALGSSRKEGGGCSTPNRVKKVQAVAAALAQPPYSLEDTPLHVLNFETELFGCGVSLTRVETCNADDVNCTCREFLAGRGELCILGVEVKALRTAKTKRGRTPGAEMAHLTLGDASADIPDVPVFPENWARWKDVLSGNKAVYVAARQDKKKKVPLMIDNIWAMKPL
jgi:DNA polymerase III alpha subunit